MDQPSSGFVVLPSDFRGPFYSVPASHNACGRDPSVEPFISRGAPSGPYDYPNYGGRPLAMKVPAISAADTSYTYGNYKGVPAVHYDPQQEARQVVSPRSMAVPVRPPTSSCDMNFLHPGYDNDHVWIPRQISSQGIQHPAVEIRNPEALAPGRLRGLSPIYFPSYSSTPHYGYSMPYQDVEASVPVPHPPFVVAPQNYGDSRYPSWKILPQRGRPDGEDGLTDLDSGYAGGRSGSSVPVWRDEPSNLNTSGHSKDRGMQQPPYAMIPIANVGDGSFRCLPGDGPNSFPTASAGYGDGGDARIDWRPSEVPERQASIIPVDFPVSDLAKIRSSTGAVHDRQPYVGKFPAYDVRRTPYSLAPASSPALIPSLNKAQFLPFCGRNQPAQFSRDMVDGLKGTEDMASRSSGNRIAPPIAVSPTQYLVNASDSLTDTNAPGIVEGIGRRPPFVPVQSTSSAPAAVLEDYQNPSVSGPLYLQPLAGSDKILEIFDDGSAAGEKGFLVTRIIPVLSSDDDHLLEKSKSTESKEVGISSESKECGVLKKPELSVGKTPKSNNDLMAKIGKAFWSSKPKPNKGESEYVSKADNFSKEGGGKLVAPKHGDYIPSNAGEDVGSHPTRKVLKTNNAPFTVEETSSLSESDSKTLKLDAPVSVNRTITMNNDRKSLQEVEGTLVGSSSHVAEETTGTGVEVHQDLHPKVSINQEQEGATSSSNVGDAGVPLASTEKAEAEISSAEPLISSKYDANAEAGKVLVEEAASRAIDQEDISLPRNNVASLSLDGAATRIQARFRGHVVRQADVLRSLRVIRNLQTKLQSLQSQVCTSEDVANLLSNLKDRVKITESAMALLLELDTLQGVHPFAREMRKFLAQEIVKFQDRLDAVMKGELVLPSANSSSSNAESVAEVAESEAKVKEESLITTGGNVGSCQNETDPDADMLLPYAGGNGCAPKRADYSETTAVHVATTEVGKSPSEDTVTVDESGASDSLEGNVNTIKDGDTAVVDSNNGGGEDKGDMNPPDDKTHFADGDNDCLTGNPKEAALQNSVPEIEDRDGDDLSMAKLLTTSENEYQDSLVRSRPECETDVEGQSQESSLQAEEIEVILQGDDHAVPNISQEDGARTVHDASSSMPTEEVPVNPRDDQDISPNMVGEYHHALPVETVQDAVVKDYGVATIEVQEESSCKDSSGLEVGVHDAPSLLPSEEINITLRNDEDVSTHEEEGLHDGLPMVSLQEAVVKNYSDAVVEVQQESQNEVPKSPCENPLGAEVRVGVVPPSLLMEKNSRKSHHDVPLESLQNPLGKDDGDAGVEVQEENENVVSEVPSIEEIEFTLKNNQDLRLSEEGVIDDAVPREYSDNFEENDNGDGVPEVREDSEVKTSELSCRNPFEAEVGVHNDSFPCPSEEAQGTLKDNGDVRSSVEEKMHDAYPAVSSENFGVKDDGDGVAEAPEENQIGTSARSCENPSGVAVHHDSYRSVKTEDINSSREGDHVGDSCLSEQCERSQSPEPAFDDLSASLGLRDIGSEGELMLRTQDEVLGANITQPSTLNKLIDNVNEHASPTETFESTDDMKVGSGGSVHIVAPLTHSEETEIMSVIATTPKRDEVTAKYLQKEDIGSELSCPSPCSNENFDVGVRCHAGGKNKDSRDQGVLVQQLIDENRRLQTVFREVVKSNTDQRSMIHDMVDRLGKLEQLVKEQDLRKEKRKKSKNNRH